MKKYFYYILGLIFLFPLKITSVFALSMKDFKETIYRPDNLIAGQAGSVSAEGKVLHIINYLIDLILYASGSIAVLMLVYGGVRLIISFGNTEEKDATIKIIKYAAIGLIVVILSYALVSNVIDLIFKATT